MKDLGFRPTSFMFGGAPKAHEVLPVPGLIRSKEIVRGVRRQLSAFLPPLPGEPGARTAADNPNPSLFQIMDEVERRIIIAMLERCGWNQTEAAERFMIPVSTLNQKIKRLGIAVVAAAKSMRTPRTANSHTIPLNTKRRYAVPTSGPHWPTVGCPGLSPLLDYKENIQRVLSFVIRHSRRPSRSTTLGAPALLASQPLRAPSGYADAGCRAAA
jgi:DNA-binding protein Fis